MSKNISASSLEHSTLVELLRWRATNYPDKRAYSFLNDGEVEKDCLTFAQLDRQARVISSLLQQYAKTGERALLIYPSGNTDENVFRSPRDFDISRPNLGRHVTFGGGTHRCVGLALARMELKVAAQEIFRRLDNFKLTVPVDTLEFMSGVPLRAYLNLPIRFSRRKAD